MAVGELPVGVLLDHLVDFEQEGVIPKGPAHTLLVDPKLGRRHRLALGDLGQVELKLFVVSPLRRELPVVLHCGTIRNHRSEHLHYSPVSPTGVHCCIV